MSSHLKNIVVLASGSGTNLQAIIDAIADGEIAARIAAVISDRKGARALQRATTHNIKAIHTQIGPSNSTGYDDLLIELIAEHQPELIVLAGYMRILSPEFVSRYAQLTINLHPSLLPAYKGTNTHARVIAAGDRQHGATVHFITSALDDGPAIAQYRVAVLPNDDVESLSARVHRAEHILLPRTIAWFCERRLCLIGKQVMLDSIALAQPIIFEDQK